MILYQLDNLIFKQKPDKRKINKGLASLMRLTDKLSPEQIRQAMEEITHHNKVFSK